MKNRESDQPLSSLLVAARGCAREEIKRFNTLLPLIKVALEKIDLDSLQSARKENKSIERNLEDRIEELLECCLAAPPSREVEKIRSVLSLLSNLKMISKHLFELMEEINIKISEDILFSNRAFKQLMSLWSLVNDTFGLLSSQLQTQTGGNADRLSASCNQIMALIDQYDIEHEERLIRGICPIKASSMFLDILDSIRNITRRLRAISVIF